MTRDRVHQVFGPNVSPAISVSRGETIVVETQDCYRGLLTEEPHKHNDDDRNGSIPVTGPIYVEDASIGDVLSIQVKQITTAGNGVFAVRPETGVPGQDIQKPRVRVLEVNENAVHLDERIKLPLHPVIGSMGVAAKHGEIDTVYPGRHGGNMDTVEITTGSRVYLPVQVNGALLSLGDVKACVGDGQIAGSGVEVEAEVTLRVDTLPGGRFSWPRVESKGEWITITSASTVDQAARLAITEMVKWISQDKGLDFDTAYALVSLGGSLRVSQWGNPLTTARMVFPKRLINKLKSVPAASGRLNYRVLPPATNGDADTETVAADAEQPAARSSRRSGSGRSQRGSGRTRQSGGRRGTRQKSNGAPSPASEEDSQKEVTGQEEAAASRLEAAASRLEEAAASRQEEAASQQEEAAASQQEEAAARQQEEAASQEEAAARQQEEPAAESDEKESRSAAQRGRQGGRASRTGRRRRPASRKDAAPEQADASAVATESSADPAEDKRPGDEDRKARNGTGNGAGQRAAGSKDAQRSAAEPKDAEQVAAEPKDAEQVAAEPKDADRKPTFGRRQRTVRRA